MGSRVRKPSKKFAPAVIPPDLDYRFKLEGVEAELPDPVLVMIDLQRIIPSRSADHFYKASRAVVKGAEQIHARMLIMGLEKVPWHELGPDSYDSYCIAAYDVLRTGLQQVITFEEVSDERART